ncbi:MAG TPA: GNAT family N-acetyltransferase [Phycisphaerales bacterium]|nr:GNAT family N-acetyltransferase [Phycisphaerales bacterium]
MILIKRIDADDPLYAQELDLRQRVLLRPIGYSIEAFRKDFPGVEEKFEHFVAVASHPKGPRVVGTVCLLPHYPKKGVGKLMQMAVDPQRQGEGIGKLLVVELERRAFGELKLRELFCHARIGVEAFYGSIGWAPSGPEFTEAGIPHVKMLFSAGKPNPPKRNAKMARTKTVAKKKSPNKKTSSRRAAVPTTRRRRPAGRRAASG